MQHQCLILLYWSRSSIAIEGRLSRAARFAAALRVDGGAPSRDIAKMPRKPTTTSPRGTPAPTLPVMTEQAVLQNDSRPLVSQALRPWPVTDWVQHDYGIDAMVEVATPRDGAPGFHVTGRRIALQIKANGDTTRPSRPSVEVNVRTLLSWFASHEPVALVFCHVPSKDLAYRWVDDALVTELGARDPSWFTRDTVEVHIPWTRGLAPDRLADIDREARLVLIRRHRVLAPGTYDRLLTEAQATMAEVVATAKSAGFQSVLQRLSTATENVRASTYVVALAGRMRAGKSTLFNALVRRDISPVARRPTTAVPVLVTAGAAEEAVVTFLDGRRQHVRATSDEIAAFATQEANPNNHLAVHTVVVRLVSERLERGIAILDAPGLFDPSPSIQAVTARAIAGAHAVLFVMDVSCAQDGGFAVEAHVVDELRRVLSHSERVFLLLNKSDRLGAEDKADVLATLGSTLSAEGLAGRFAAEPAFVSAKAAWEWARDGASGPSPIAQVEDQVWDFLLRTNATGVARLETAVREAMKAVDESRKLLRMRRASAEEARRAQERLALGERAILGLRDRNQRELNQAHDLAVARLQAELGAVSATIGRELRAAGSIPTPEALSARVNNLATAALKGTWTAARWKLDDHVQRVSAALEAALDQVRLNHDSPSGPTLYMPPLALPRADLLAPEAFGYSLIGGLLGILFNPGAAILGALGSFFFGAWSGKEKKLEAEIVKIERKIDNHVRVKLVQPARDVVGTVVTGYQRVNRWVDDRWAVFEKDVREQLRAAGEPLSAPEAARLDHLDAHLSAARRRLEAVGEEIRWVPAGSAPHP